MEKTYYKSIMEDKTTIYSHPDNIKKSYKYVIRYINELKLHFSLSDSQILKVLNLVINEIKRKNTTKKRWFFFK